MNVFNEQNITSDKNNNEYSHDWPCNTCVVDLFGNLYIKLPQHFAANENEAVFYGLRNGGTLYCKKESPPFFKKIKVSVEIFL